MNTRPASQNANQLGPNLKIWLLKNGLSQKELASDIGVREATVSAWISGQSIPRAKVLRKIATHYGLKIVDFLNEISPVRSPRETRADSRDDHKKIQEFIKTSAEEISIREKQLEEVDAAMSDLEQALNTDAVQQHAEVRAAFEKCIQARKVQAASLRPLILHLGDIKDMLGRINSSK